MRELRGVICSIGLTSRNSRSWANKGEELGRSTKTKERKRQNCDMGFIPLITRVGNLRSKVGPWPGRNKDLSQR